jgi:signal transduction histidine kinase
MNAAQAMGGPGEIDVTIDVDADGCRIAIRGYRPGMPPEVRDMAFDAFFTRKHRRTGLGLPSARRIVEANGRIELTPADGAGTRASIHLPPSPPSP